MILIVSNPQDIHAKHIARNLRLRGCDVLCLSRSDFGDTASLALQPLSARGSFSLSSGETIDTNNVSAVWYRRPGKVRVDPQITTELDRAFAENEWAQALDAFFTTAFRRVVSPPLRQRAATKPLQLALASQIGLRAPETLVTNNAEVAQAFVAKHQGAVVHKAITAPPHQFLDTRSWDEEASRHIDDLTICPTILQERILGPADVRTTVVGRRTFSARIESSGGTVDSRLDADALCIPYRLPSGIEAGIYRLMDELGLKFGTIDFKLADGGELVFLEVNPQGQFLYIEILTGLPISNALTDFLADGDV